MGIEYLNQELTKRINSLQTELDICKRQKEVISIITSLKSIENAGLGYTNVTPEGLNISPEGIADFISLLDSSEYLKGYNNGGNDIFGEHPRLHKYNNYYLTLGPGIVLELSFCETEMKVHGNSIKEYELNIISYQGSQNLCIRAVEEEVPTIEILTQDGSRICGSITTEEYLTFNGKQFNEAIVPISPDDLANRFLGMMKNPEEKGMKK